MKITIVTCAYSLRRSRDFNFYLNPLNDLLSNLSNSDLNIKLFTNRDAGDFVEGKNIDVCVRDIDSLVKPIWDDASWKETYKLALKDRSSLRFEEKEVPELIGIWLGKFQMLKEAAEDCDAVLWQDAGIRNYLFGRQANNYKKKRIFPTYYKSAIGHLLSKSSIALLSSTVNDVHFHGVDMTRYGVAKKYVRAGFILMNSSEALNLRDQISFNWNHMVSNGDFGTEENPLTLFSWTRPDAIRYSLDDWFKMFRLDLENRII
jgi:hypothetical protein